MTADHALLTHTSGVPHDLVARTVGELEGELVRLRRDLHAHPEPSWAEHRTTQVLFDRLVAAGLAPVVAAPGTGVVCDIGEHGPLIMIRGDIDALRMPDAKAVPYRSTIPGVCHACGHDLHAVAALGAALAVAAVLEAEGRPGRLRLVLQPAEESVPGGAVDLVAAGVMHEVEAAFALHADPSLAVGSIGVSAGPITSAADQIEVLLHGPGGHTGRPHQTVDLVHLAARVVTDLPVGLGRMSDPRDGLNLTFGSIQAGDAPNVIPTEAVVQGSLRCTGRPTWDAAPDRIRSLLAGLLDPFGVEWELIHRRGAPPIVNDPWAVRMVERAGVAVVGAADVGPTEQSAGGEDFSWYGEHAPVGYVRLGVRGPGAPRVDLHAGTFDIDEQAVALGARLLAGTALEAMADLASA